MSAAPRPRPAAVVFDFDGVLLDTAPAWEGAYEDVLAPHGAALTDADRAALLGASVPMAAAHLGARIGLGGATGALEAELARRLAARMAADARPLPDAEALLHRLAGGPPLAVASNGPSWVVTEALERAGMLAAFAAVLGADHVARPKPAPDLYLGACERLGAPPARAVAIEDSPLGAAAARAAGLLVVCRPLVPVTGLDADVVVAGLDDAALAAPLGLEAAR